MVPRGFVRIRSYGFLANRDRKLNVDNCRRLIGELAEPEATLDEDSPPMPSPDTTISAADPDRSGRRCPLCKAHLLRRGINLAPGFELARAIARLGDPALGDKRANTS